MAHTLGWWLEASKDLLPICSPPLFQKQQHQGVLVSATLADTPARAAALARVTQHAWAVNLAFLLSRGVMILGKPLVLSGPWYSHLENGADQLIPGVRTT